MKSNEYKDKEFKTNKIEVGNIPGINQAQHTIGLQVKGNITGGSKTLYFTFTAGDSLGTRQYTGFGFTPTKYEILAWLNDTNTTLCQSFAYYDGNVKGYLVYPSTYNSLSSRMIAVYSNSAGTVRTRANHSALLSDGVELDFIDNANSIQFKITAYQ